MVGVLVVVNSAVAYGMAVLTALVLAIGGVVLAAPTDDVIEAAVADTEVPVTARVADVTTIAPSTTAAPVPVAVPPLGGLTQSAARAVLGDLGLDVTTSFVDATVGYAIDLVVASSPPEGTAMLPGDAIDISVGQRPEPATVERATPILWEAVEFTDPGDETVGRCGIGRLGDDGLLTVDRADCANPHDFQYLATVNVGESFATWEDAGPSLREACNDAFGSFVGAPLAGSDLSIYMVIDTDSGSTGAKGYCLLRHIRGDSQLVGDAAGSLW